MLSKFEVQTLLPIDQSRFNNTLGQMEHTHTRYMELMFKILNGFNNYIIE